MSCFSLFSPVDGDEVPPQKKEKVKEALRFVVSPNPSKNISVFYEHSITVNDRSFSIGAVTCTEDGDLFAFSYGNEYKICDFKTFNVLFSETYENDQVKCIEFSKNKSLWIGTMNGMIYNISPTFQIQEFFKNDYAILSITLSKDNSHILFSNMDMTIFYYNIKEKTQISTMKGKAVSVDGISFDYKNRLVTTSFEHITHIWDSQGKLTKAMVPIKESTFTNGKGYILNTKNGCFIADKKSDRKRIGETYVWDLETEKQILYFKSLDSTQMILRDYWFIFDNGTEICIYDACTKQIEDKLSLKYDDISCLYGCNDYFLSGTVDGVFLIFIYCHLGDYTLSLPKGTLDVHFSFK